MIKFDFYKEDINTLKKEELLTKLKSMSMSGFLDYEIDNSLYNKMNCMATTINKTNSILLVIGIGGSYMGSKAIISLYEKVFSPKKVIYIGNDLDSNYLLEVLEYVKDKDIYVCVISKSGKTKEIEVTFKILKDVLKSKYDNYSQRVILITTKDSPLYINGMNNNYNIFLIPDNIGGRYSVFTPAGIFPMLVFGLDTDLFIEGKNKAKNLEDDAYNYAYLRNSLYNKGYYVENFVVYNKKLLYFTEWLKQLFAESEGKEDKGILPINSLNTRDLHSLGQYLQSGKKMVFETVIFNDKVNNEIDSLNKKVFVAVATVHNNGHTPVNSIIVDDLDIKTMGSLMYFFMLSVSISSLMLGVNPFDQPGVEKYKEELASLL